MKFVNTLLCLVFLFLLNLNQIFLFPHSNFFFIFLQSPFFLLVSSEFYKSADYIIM